MAELTRRDLLKGAGAVVGALATYSLASTGFQSTAGATTAPAPPTWNDDPASPIGPPQWGNIGYPVCGQGMSQSPVNIDLREVGVLRGAPLKLRYQVSELAVENNGHAVEVVIPPGVTNTLQIGGDRYSLTQFHFHAPAEHTINGRQADVEAHFVHSNAQGATTVVGVLYRIGRKPNPLLDRILLAAPLTAGDEVPAGEASPSELFQDIQSVRVQDGCVQVNSFFSYDGSLTTPACTQSVRWSVLAGGGHVSAAAVARFHQLISQFPGYGGFPNNNRPVQPLDGRVVNLRRGSSHRR